MSFLWTKSDFPGAKKVPEQSRTSGQTESERRGSEVPRIWGCLPTGYFAILDLLAQPVGVRIFYPRKYLSAALEMFAIALIVCWLVTLIFKPEQIRDHPGYDRIGSYNPCYGWDYQPANFIAVILCSVNVFLTYRYAWFEVVRTKLRMFESGKPPGWADTAASCSATFLAIASNVWMVLWIVGPTDGNWNAHTAVFIVYAAACYLATLGNYIETRFGDSGRRAHVINWKHNLFLAIYTFATILLPACYITDLAMYKPGRSPPVPPWLTQTSDFLWMGCVMFITSFTPPDEPLKVVTELVTVDELEELESAGSVARPAKVAPGPEAAEQEELQPAP